MIFFLLRKKDFLIFLVIMDGDNKISNEEEQMGKKNVDELSKKNLERINNIRDSLEQFFETVTKDEL